MILLKKLVIFSKNSRKVTNLFQTESSSLDMLTKEEITWGTDYANKPLAEPLWRREMYQDIMILISAFLRLCEEYKNLKKELYSSANSF